MSLAAIEFEEFRCLKKSFSNFLCQSKFPKASHESVGSIHTENVTEIVLPAYLVTSMYVVLYKDRKVLL